MRVLYLIAVTLAALALLTYCGTQPPMGHSEGPQLMSPVVGRTASARVDRGDVVEVQLLPGMVRVDSIPLFFEMEGLPFDRFHVLPGQFVQEGQLLATLYTPRQRELVANQEALIDRLHRSHSLSAEAWAIDYELLHLRYIERMRTAANSFDEAAMDEAQRLYLEMDRMRLLREHDEEWQRLERADAYTRLAELHEDLKGTDLLAPFDGTITHVASLSHGNFPGQARIILYIAPADGPQIVEYTGEALPNRSRVTRIEGDVNGLTFDLTHIPLAPEEVAYNSLHGLTRRERFALPEGLTLPLGAHVRILAYTVEIHDTLRIPTAALVGMGAAAYVYRLENGAWMPVQITIGARAPAFVEILDGLSEGDELLVN
jgi:multidrug efflux pump subunit AcrA (membrane-fusion protein)